MTIGEILNLLALIIIPLLAVWLGRYLQDRSEKRKDKLQIFKILMTARIYGWTVESVHALNIIDIVFSDDKSVREAWHDLNDKYHVNDPDDEQLKDIENAQYRLLETMANALGYKEKITWEDIQNPYIPDGMAAQIIAQKNQQRLYGDMLEKMDKIIPQTKADSAKKREQR